MKCTIRAGLLLVCFLLFRAGGLAQAYFKILEQPKQSHHKKIARFSNGDILIGDSPLDAQATDRREIILMRLDPCGHTVWAKGYKLGPNYLEFKDFVLTPAGDVYILGSAYIGAEEMILLMHVSPDGEVLRFRMFYGGTVDHFTFSLDFQNSQLLAYGLLLHWNIPKRGFVAVFDEDLLFQWGKKFAPFESFGEAIFTHDKGFLCRSGPYLVKLNAQGALEWANIFDTGQGAYPLSGPLEVDGGYLLEAYDKGFACFYKMDNSGALVWKSAKFPSTQDPAGMTLLEDGKVLASWNFPESGQLAPSFLYLSPGGEILEQHQLIAPQGISAGQLSHTLAKDRILHLVGSSNPFQNALGQVSDFVLQVPLDSLSGECFFWEKMQAVLPNDLPIQFAPLDTAIQDASMKDVTTGSIVPHPLDIVVRDMCNEVPAPSLLQRDTLLGCDEIWTVYLPGPGFRWDDQSTDNPRALTRAGSYTASDRQRCNQPVTYAYRLEKQDCDCPVFIPNVFSPDGDGQNDRLELVSPCQFVEYQLSVFDRWGNKIFAASAPEDAWGGTWRHKPVLPGVYLATLRYQLLDKAGTLREGTLVQDVTVIY
ncbi:MAG: gliding motility-associated C-terminal domain-containing protein [Saprospiraceae bacterium]|nr:gliding motility-associated C-terminal domain-containing protein [Saprospiraceae bacterium]